MSISEQIIGELQAWLNRPDDQSLEQFLSQRVGVEESESILHAVDQGRRCYDELQAAREEGVSREVWLARALRDHLTSDEDTGDVSLTLSDAVTLTQDTPAALARSLKDELVGAVWGARADEDPIAQITSPLLEPIGKAVEEAAALAPEPVKTFLDEYFTSPVHDKGERDVVSVISGAVQKESLNLEPSARPSTEHLGSVVDYGMFSAKVAAHVGRGTLNATTAIDLVEDRAAAHIARGVRRVADQALVKGGATVGGFLGGLIGMAPLGAQVGAVAGKLASRAISPLIEKGAKVVVKTARKVVSSVVKSAGKMVSKVASWFGW